MSSSLQPQKQTNSTEKTNALALVSFFTAFYFPLTALWYVFVMFSKNFILFPTTFTICLSPITTIAAIVLGHMALFQAAKYEKPMYGFAILGLILGYLSIFLFIFEIVIIFNSPNFE